MVLCVALALTANHARIGCLDSLPLSPYFKVARVAGLGLAE